MRLQNFSLPKLTLRGSVKTSNKELRIGNPLKRDPILIDLLNQLEKVNNYDAFCKWRSDFLDRLEYLLFEGGGYPGVDKSEEAYATFRVKVHKMVRVVATAAHYVNDGKLSVTRVSVKAHNVLNESLKSSQAIREHLKSLAPSNGVEEEAVGYTRYHSALVLVRHGFQEYELLNMCKDIQQVLREKVINLVADRQILLEMDKYVQAIEAFTVIMMKEIGLMQILRKQRQLKPSQPPKFLMDEIRGTILKEALIAKSLESKSSSTLPPSEGSRHSRGHHTDKAPSRMNSIQSCQGPKPSRMGDNPEKQSKARSSGRLSDASQSTTQVFPPSGNPQVERERGTSARERGTSKPMKSSSIENPETRRTRQLSTHSKMSDELRDASTASRHTNSAGSKPSRISPVSEVKESSNILKSVGNIERKDRGFTKDDVRGISTGLVKFEPKQPRKLKAKSWTTILRDDDDEKSVVSIASKKKAKMKAKQARKGKQLMKNSVRDKANAISRKLRTPVKERRQNGLDEVTEESDDDCSQIDAHDEDVRPKELDSMTDHLTEHQPWRSGPWGSVLDDRRTDPLRSSNRVITGPSDEREPINEIRESISKPKTSKSKYPSVNSSSQDGFEKGTSKGQASGATLPAKPYERTESQKEKSSKRHTKDSELHSPRKQRGTITSQPGLPYLPRNRHAGKEKTAHTSEGSKERSSRSRKQLDKSEVEVSISLKPKDLRLNLVKHGFPNSGVDSYKKFGGGSQTQAKPGMSQNVSISRTTGVNTTPPKLTMQWPPPKLEYKANLPGSLVYQFNPEELSKTHSTRSKKPSTKSSTDSISTGQQKASDNRGPRKMDSKGKSFATGSRKSPGRGSVALPSLLDDCSSLDVEDNDLEIFEDMNQSYSSIFERKRSLFENLGNKSTPVSLSYTKAEPNDVNGLDPLKFLENKGDGSTIIQDQSTISVGGVSEKRTLFENFQKSGRLILGPYDLHEDEADSLDQHETPKQRLNMLDESIHSIGHVSRQRSKFEELNASLHSPGGLAEKRSSFSAKSNEFIHTTLVVEGRQLELHPAKVTYLSNDYSVAKESRKFDHSSEMTRHVDSDNDSIDIEKTLNEDEFLEKNKSQQKYAEHIDQTEDLKAAAQSKSLICAGSDHRGLQSDDGGPAKPGSDWTENPNAKNISTEQNEAWEVRAGAFEGLRTTSNELKPWSRRAQPWNKDRSTEDSKPWTRRDADGPPGGGQYVDPTTFRRRRELWEMQTSSHGGAEKSKLQYSNVVHDDQNPDNLDRNCGTSAEHENQEVLSAEEEAMRMADEVAKLAIEEKARQKALEQVRREAEEEERERAEEERIRAVEEARLMEEEEALRMAEAVVTMEAEKEAHRTSEKENRFLLQQRSGLNTHAEGRLVSISPSPWVKRVDDETHGRQTTGKKPVRILSEHSSTSVRIFEDEGRGKIFHFSADSTSGRKFRPIPSWASRPEEDERSRCSVKKSKSTKIRTAVAAKKSSAKTKSGRMKPQHADDSSVVKVKKANSRKGEVTFTKKPIPAMGVSARNREPAHCVRERWQVAVGS